MFDRAGGRKYLNGAERRVFFLAMGKERDPLIKTLCLTLFWTGCRISEALNLRWAQVDSSGQALVFETLKRRKRGQYRSVPIPPALLRGLSDLKNPSAPDDLIWPVSRTTAYRWIKAAMDNAEISGTRASPKGLRHSHAIACIGRHVPLTVVKKWLGHARLETTAIYLDVIGEEERALAKRLWRMR